MTSDQLILTGALFVRALEVGRLDHRLESFVIGVAIELPNVAVVSDTSTRMEIISIVRNSRLRDTLFDNVDPEFPFLENNAHIFNVLIPRLALLFNKPFLEATAVHLVWQDFHQAGFPYDVVKFDLILLSN